MPEAGHTVLRLKDANPRSGRTEDGRRQPAARAGRQSGAVRAAELRRRIHAQERHRAAVQAPRAQLVASVHAVAR